MKRRSAATWWGALALALGACVRFGSPPRLPGGPDDEATRFLDAWARDDLPGQRALLDQEPPGFEAQQREWRRKLGVVATRFELRGSRAADGGGAVVDARLVHTLRGLGDWARDVQLSFVRSAGRWRLRWTPAVLAPEARAGDGFQRTRSFGARAAIVDADGDEIPREVAAHTRGRVGPITAAQLASLGAPYQVGDVVGQSGLERAYERTLAGTPSGDVLLVRPDGERVKVHHFEGTDGEALRTTLRLDVQRAADDALAGVVAPAAIAAVDLKRGDVLALANRPNDAGINRALTGLYPPGSTFKIVTTAALAERSGLTAESKVPCPAEAVIAGARFRNFEGEVLGTTTLRRAFALSCNTTFVTLGAALGEEGLTRTAAKFGFGVDYGVGLPAPRSPFPIPRDEPERAAASIGQGRVLATPLHMASVVAAAVSGTWRSPRLVRNAEPTREEDIGRDAREVLRTLLAAVVREGTGKAAARVEGLVGKTGTAEFGTTVPPATHAWFVGVRGDVAFAVVVEGGGVGGRVAAPIAARFAERL